ncbi:MAG: response regulator [Stellaceae bacterium]
MPRILLVDDDTAVRLVFLEILFDAGYEVDTAHSFAAREAMLDSGHPFDLLITDGRFDGGTGSALAGERGIPVLVVTGDTFGIDGAKYRVLAKPMRPEALLTAVATAPKDGSR